MARQDAKASNVVVTGIITIGSYGAYALIDPGSTYSYVSPSFSIYLERGVESLNVTYIMVTIVGETISVDRVYKDCVIFIQGRDTIVDLLVLPISDFDVIMGMDCLASCCASIDCHSKLIHFDFPGEPCLVWKGITPLTEGKIISYVKARRMINNGCLGFIATVHDTRLEDVTIDSVPVVRKFADVFPEDLPELPPIREIEFSIDLVPGTQPISIPLYRLAPAELRGLKVQLQEILDKGLIRPISFLGHVVSRDRIQVDPRKIAWSNECEESFQKLKTALTTAPILTLPTSAGVFTIYCDASRVGLGYVLMQNGKVVAYAFRQLKNHEENYPTHDLELAAIALANRRVHIDHTLPGRLLAGLVAQLSLVGQVKARQFEDFHLAKLRDRVQNGGVKSFAIDREGDVKQLILEEAHNSRYSIHPGASKMYQDLRELYWWKVRLPRTFRKQDSVWVIVDRLTKTAHFIPVELRTTFHPHTDGQFERVIQILEDVLRACAIKFGGHWDDQLPLAEFTYNNNYQSSIQMAPFEALYGRKCRSPVGWFEPGEARLLGPNLV
ncbi:uncharacterized protein LOC142171828 [Nicotiana tabacum]|uniref:Uncharacterized protein LOC142171828 n=1 Tax=Nicotiana tabacum TaxID=4097 RepID=A0AC58T323_TOBAC